MTSAPRLSRPAARGDGITLIHLFEIEQPGGAILRLTGDTETVIGFGGVSYTPVPLEASGFAWNSQSSPAHPVLTVTHAPGLFGASLDHGGMQGAKVTRIVTFSSECDPPVGTGGGAAFTPECWLVERISRLDGNQVTFDLQPEARMDGQALPSRVMLGDLCQHRYRIWDADQARFDYRQATCPYTEATCFDDRGNPVEDQARDQCSLRLDNGCRKRFEGQLPFLGFPGLGGF